MFAEGNWSSRLKIKNKFTVSNIFQPNRHTGFSDSLLWVQGLKINFFLLSIIHRQFNSLIELCLLIIWVTRVLNRLKDYDGNGRGFSLKPEDFIEYLYVVAFDVVVGDLNHGGVNAVLLILFNDLLEGLFCHLKISKIIQILYRENLFLTILHTKTSLYMDVLYKLHLRKLY